MIKFCELSLGKFLPALRRWGIGTKAVEELPDLLQRESDLPGSLYDCQAIEHSFVISPLSAYALRGHENADLLVVPNCGRAEADLLGYGGYRQ